MMARHSVEILDASWGAIADAARLRAAMAENNALMLSAEREKTFDGDAADARSVRFWERLAVFAAAVSVALTILGLVLLCEAMS